MALRKLSIIALALACVAAARGQESQIRYWFDKDLSAAVTVQGTSLSGSIDVAALKPGLHTLHAQAVGDPNSPVASRMFVKPFALPDSVKGREITYWFDKDYKSAVTISETSLVGELDVSGLKPGLHTLHAQGCGDALSPVSSKIFLCVQPRETDPVFTSLVYAFDDLKPGEVDVMAATDSTYVCVLDVTGLKGGVHTLGCSLLAQDGRRSAWGEATFFVVGQIDTPVIAFDGYEMTLSCELPGAELRYTLDGSEPDSTSLLYERPVDLEADCVIKARARLKDWIDSEVAEAPFAVSQATCAAPRFTGSSQSVTITTATAGAQIRYTLDGSEPTGQSALYTAPLPLAEGANLKAIAVKAKWFDSLVSDFGSDYMGIAPIEDRPKDYMLSKNYLTNGDFEDPNFVQGPDLAYSWISGVYEATEIPGWSLSTGGKWNGVCMIGNQEPDNTMVLEGNKQYLLMRNYENNGWTPIRVYTCVPGLEPGKKYRLDFFVAHEYMSSLSQADPTQGFTFYDKPASEADAKGAEIFTVRDISESNKYQYYVCDFTATSDTIVLELWCQNLNGEGNSSGVHWVNWDEVRVYDNSLVDWDAKDPSLVSPAPSIGYDGRHVKIAAAKGCEARYTLDGSEPGEEAQLYSGPFDAGGIVTVKAAAFRTGFYPSDAVDYRTPAYFDGSVATVETADSLSVAFGWLGREEIVDLKVVGQLGGDDYALLRGLPSLRVLDLEAVEADELGTGALAGVNAVGVWLPASMQAAGDGLLAGAKRLGGVVWPAEAEATAQALSGIGNPNLLLCLAEGAEAPEGFANVVTGDFAESITLVDSTPGSFFAPFAFRAGAIEYAHNYTMDTPLGGATAGWETLALPFAVQAVTHEREGRIEPFAAGVDFDEARPYWLMQAGADGFLPATAIEANTPYLVSMPNNPAYLNEYIIPGLVTFSAEDAEVEATPWASAQVGAFRFVPTTVGVAKADTVSVLNREAYDGNVPGSVFVAGERDAQPFEAYLTADARMLSKPVAVGALAGAQDGLGELARDTKWRVYVRDNVLHIYTMRAQNVTVYNVAGQAVRQVDLAVGDNAVRGLGGGVYFVKGAKALILP